LTASAEALDARCFRNAFSFCSDSSAMTTALALRSTSDWNAATPSRNMRPFIIALPPLDAMTLS
jgi:hypothetical protein